MPKSSHATLYYVHDPMCSWCWGFRATWLKLKQQLPHEVKVISRVGGLAPDSEAPMPADMRQYLQDTWRRIQQKIPGTEFNYDFWTVNTPRRSTYPACRAVIAARQLAELEEQMTYGIQQAYYLQAKNPSDLDTLVGIAAGIGLDAEAFNALMNSEEIHQSLETELSQVRSIGINSFPGLLMQQQSRQQTIALNYNSADGMLHDIHHFISAGSN